MGRTTAKATLSTLCWVIQALNINTQHSLESSSHTTQIKKNKELAHSPNAITDLIIICFIYHKNIWKRWFSIYCCCCCSKNVWRSAVRTMQWETFALERGTRNYTQKLRISSWNDFFFLFVKSWPSCTILFSCKLWP